MTQVIIQDETPRTQLTSAAGQTVFNTNWTADESTDIDVYARAFGTQADDVTQIVSPTLYDVTFIGTDQTVRVTFLSGRSLNEIITIVRNTPPERLNLYINTNFTPSMLNQDFGILTLIDQQNQMYDSIINPGYNVSEIIDPIIDRILPILDANQTWVMNSTRTKIITFTVPAGGGLAPSDATYLLQTPNPYLPNAQALGNLPSGFLVNTSTTGVQLSRVLTQVLNQTSILNGDGILGNPVIGLADNPLIPGTEGVGLPSGTTLQRPVSPSNTDLRFNTTLQALEYWDGIDWIQISESDGVTFATGTENQVLVNGTFGIPTEGAIVLNTPQDIAPTSSPTFNNLTVNQLRGANGLPVLDIVSLPSAVNYLSILNQAAGQVPGFVATGLDSNISIGFVAKGSGVFDFITTASSPAINFVTGTLNQHLTSLFFPNTAAAQNVIFQDASGIVAYLSDIPGGSPSPLTTINDVNITASLGGTPFTALLEPVSITLGWSGQLSEIRGGTAQSSYSLGDILYSSATNTLSKLPGNITVNKQYLSQTGTGLISSPPIWSSIDGLDVIGSPLSKTDDINVTLSLSGSPLTSLLRPTNLAIGWTGTLSPARGGTGINNGTSTLTMGGNHILSGSFSSTFTFTNTTSVIFPITGTLATTSQLVTPSALTKTDDINVTATLTGLPSICLVNPANIALGWTGLLSPSRGGTGVNNGSSTLTLGGSLSTAGAFVSSFIFTAATSVTFPNSGTLATTSQLPTPSALTRVNDTNLTLTLSANAPTCLLQPVALTLGWTGTLSPARGGTGVNNGTSTLTLGGNLTTIGAFSSNFTMTGNTNVTFPLSGLLATVTGSGGLKSFQVFNSGSGTYTPTAGTSSILVEYIGGGGAGGGCVGALLAYACGGGGSSGSYGRHYIASSLAVSYLFSIGAGGTPGAAGNNPGGNGGTTTFGAILTAPGGLGGRPGGSVAGGGASTTATGGNIINASGAQGGTGVALAGNAVPGTGGCSVYGGGANAPTVTSGSGNGTAGNNSGGGGSGGYALNLLANAAGGAGANGEIVIWEFA